MKIIWIIGGVLCLFFAVAQILQLAGLIGTKTFTIPGVIFVVLGIALSAGCFKKAFLTGK
jgi:uncharacterized integral membrane protein